MSAELQQAQRPIAVRPTERHTSLCLFLSGKHVELHLRGGIAWPVAPADGGRAIGFAVLVGLDVRTGISYVLEECEFYEVDHVIDRTTGLIKTPGASVWFNMLWQAYGARTLYYHQDEGLHRRYHTLVCRSAMIEPKPRIVCVPFSDGESYPRTALWSMLEAGQLVWSAGSLSYPRLAQWRASPGVSMESVPAVWALGVLAASLVMWPWRDRRREAED